MRIDNYRYLSKDEFPDCCLVCRFGGRYYGSIRCNCGGEVEHFAILSGHTIVDLDVDGVCDNFKRSNLED